MNAAVEVSHDESLDVLNAFFVERKCVRAGPATKDGHTILEWDTAGDVVGVQILGFKAIRSWSTYPTREQIPNPILMAIDAWVEG